MEKIADEVKISFRHKLSELIRLRGISKQELCRKVGITYNALFYYETGKRFPKTDVLFNLASALGVTVEELLDYPHPQPETITTNRSRRKIKEYSSALIYFEPKEQVEKVEIKKFSPVDFAKRALTMKLAYNFYHNLYNLIMYDKDNTQNITITLPDGQTETLKNDDYLNFILLKLQKSLLEFKDNYDAQMKDISYDKIP